VLDFEARHTGREPASLSHGNGKGFEGERTALSQQPFHLGGQCDTHFLWSHCQPLTDGHGGPVGNGAEVFGRDAHAPKHAGDFLRGIGGHELTVRADADAQ
jgi:hypothetical protein